MRLGPFLLAVALPAAARAGPADRHPWLPGDEPCSVSVGTIRDGYVVRGAALPGDDPAVSVLATQRARDLAFATAALVEALVRAAHAVDRELPGSPLHLGNLGRRHGGDIPWSVSHNSGRDADVAFYLLDPGGRPAVRNDLVRLDDNGWGLDAEGAVRLDVRRTWAFVRALLTDPNVVVQYLFVSTPLRALLLAEGERRADPPELLAQAAKVLTQPRGALPHDDHLHVRIHCREVDAAHGCRELGPQREGAVDIAEIAARRGEQALGLLASEDPDVRRRAAHLLGLLRHRPASAPLGRLLRDEAPEVRVRAAWSLVDLRARDQARAVAQALRREENVPRQWELAWVLTELDPRRAARALPRLTDGTARLPSGRPLRAELAGLLADGGRPEAVPPLLDLLVDPEPEVVVAAAVALARLTNVDLGSEPRLWRDWWKDNRSRPRDEWLAAGFRAAGYAVGARLQRGDVRVLLKAVAAPEPHLSENARRALMRLLHRRGEKQLMWPPEDAAWGWRKSTPRHRR